ncbi:hypothetical protein [Nitratireductor luteus]|uniref:hypothetical protein n=1 Tax=Nitratireductor luteus TaxID=2976980 RepID=UPI00223EB429|nr:hypothetical protein [Nitratireductor luteus]
MTENPVSPTGTPALPDRPALTLMRIVGLVSVTLFVATEIVAATGAGLWALTGLLGLGEVGTLVVGAVLGLPALYAVYICARLAFKAEMDPAND